MKMTEKGKELITDYHNKRELLITSLRLESIPGYNVRKNMDDGTIDPLRPYAYNKHQKNHLNLAKYLYEFTFSRYENVKFKLNKTSKEYTMLKLSMNDRLTFSLAQSIWRVRRGVKEYEVSNVFKDIGS